MRSIVNDPWALRIHQMLQGRYYSQLSQARLVELYKAEPYFKLVYEKGRMKWSFIALYDYFQKRIIAGNVTQTEMTS